MFFTRKMANKIDYLLYLTIFKYICLTNYNYTYIVYFTLST